MRQIFTYIFIVFFSLGSVQASTHYCVNMDAQKDSNIKNSTSNESTSDVADSLSDNQTLCHLVSEEPASDDDSNNTCCDESCGSCTSIVVTFNSLKNNYEPTYTEQYKQYGSFFILSNHIKIPTPPPNS